MLWLFIILLLLTNALWLLLVPFGLPGNWLIVVTTSLFAWWRRQDDIFSTYTLITVAVLALIGELVELFAGAGAARKAGAGLLASVLAIVGALIGALAGTFVLPLVGTILGGCVGAGLAVWLVELATGKTADVSLRSGLGAGIGHLVGSTSKFAIGAVIWVIAAIAALYP